MEGAHVESMIRRPSLLTPSLLLVAQHWHRVLVEEMSNDTKVTAHLLDSMAESFFPDPSLDLDQFLSVVSISLYQGQLSFELQQWFLISPLTLLLLRETSVVFHSFLVLVLSEHLGGLGISGRSVLCDTELKGRRAETCRSPRGILGSVSNQGAVIGSLGRDHSFLA